MGLSGDQIEVNTKLTSELSLKESAKIEENDSDSVAKDKSEYHKSSSTTESMSLMVTNNSFEPQTAKSEIQESDAGIFSSMTKSINLAKGSSND